jgi:hypothetical protein
MPRGNKTPAEGYKNRLKIDIKVAEKPEIGR